MPFTFRKLERKQNEFVPVSPGSDLLNGELTPYAHNAIGTYNKCQQQFKPYVEKFIEAHGLAEQKRIKKFLLSIDANNINKLEDILSPGQIESFKKTVLPNRLPSLNFTASDKATNCHILSQEGDRGYQQDYFSTGKLQGFLELPENVKKNTVKEVFAKLKRQTDSLESGSTGCLNIIAGKKVYTASVGDSPSFVIILRKNGSIEVKQLNRLHTLENAAEQERLKNLGKPLEVKDGVVQRLGGKKTGEGLNLTRAFGDKEKQAAGVTADLDEVSVYELPENLDQDDQVFQLTSSDSILDLADKDESIEAALANKIKEIKRENPAVTHEQLSEALATQIKGKCVEKRKPMDNTTLVLAPINPKSEIATYSAVFDGHGKSDETAAELSKTMPSLLTTSVNQYYLDEFDRLKNTRQQNLDMSGLGENLEKSWQRGEQLENLPDEAAQKKAYAIKGSIIQTVIDVTQVHFLQDGQNIKLHKPQDVIEKTQRIDAKWSKDVNDPLSYKWIRERWELITEAINSVLVFCGFEKFFTYRASESGKRFADINETLVSHAPKPAGPQGG